MLALGYSRNAQSQSAEECFLNTMLTCQCQGQVKAAALRYLAAARAEVAVRTLDSVDMNVSILHTVHSVSAGALCTLVISCSMNLSPAPGQEEQCNESQTTAVTHTTFCR